MTVKRNWVGQVSNVLADILKKSEQDAGCPAQTTQMMTGEPWVATADNLTVRQSARDRALREIRRIAVRYVWGTPEVVLWLDVAKVESTNSLSDSQVEQLLARMRLLDECSKNDWEPPDSPAAP